MLQVGASAFLFGTFFLISVANAEDCTKALAPRVTQFRASMEKWLALVNLVKMTSDRRDQSKIDLGYSGFNLSADDAEAASSFYEQKTKYNLSEAATISLTSTEVPRDSVLGFVECVKNTRQEILVSAPSGADNQEAFQIIVSWRPNYNVSILPVLGTSGTTNRTASVNVTNGRLIVPEKEISPQGAVVFNVVRDSLDKPIFISASIDGRESDFFSFPARPQSELKLTPVKNEISIVRSGQVGPSGASLPLCLPDPQGSSQYLIHTVKSSVTGSGDGWQSKSHIEVAEPNPLSICATVTSDAVGCVEDKCAHTTIGHLSATLISIVNINYPH